MSHTRLLVYALDSQNNIVYVDNVVKGLTCNCYCPACKERLVAKNGGTKRIHHFAHASGVDCEGAYETMLHILAKNKVQEAFFKGTEFNIQFEYRSYCPKAKSCKWLGDNDCYTSTTKTYNLREFYDSCKQEVKYDLINRRSDLKFYSSKNPKRPPLYIEFYVTHASDDFKLHNGGKIIEVKIESEKDIEKIVENGFIESVKSNKTYMYFEGMNNSHNITFWNFKTEDYDNNNISQEIKFSRYILYPSGESECYQDVSNCKNLVKVQKQSLIEICFFNYNNYYNIGLIQGLTMYQGYYKFGIKNCLYCRNYIPNLQLCWLKNKNSIIRNALLDKNIAKKCSDFILNIDYMNEGMAHFNSLNSNEYTILLE